MLIYLIKDNRLETFTIPVEVNGNFWITDSENNGKRNLINLEAIDNQWLMTSNYDFDLYVNGKIVENTLVNNNSFYFLKHHSTSEVIMIFCTKINGEVTYYSVHGTNDILIGKNTNCHIKYNNNLIAPLHTKLNYIHNKWQITNLDPSYRTYVNGFAIDNAIISNGDVIFIMGLKIIPLGNCLIITAPDNSLETTLPIKEVNKSADASVIEDDDTNLLVYSKEEYFNRAPRIRSKIETAKMRVDEPPKKIKEDDTPLLIALGPMMTMSMTAVVTIYSGVSRAVNNNQGIGSVFPSIIMGLTMLGTMLVWPFITRKFNERRKRKLEHDRRDKYELYIQEKRQEIIRHITQQRQILQENFPSLETCAEIIFNRKTKLWEREAEDDDFLTIRLGLGTVPLDIEISYPEDRYEMEEDVLKEIVRNLIDEAKEITGAPISVSLYEKQITGVIGQPNLTKEFIKGILLQLITFYSGDILKFIILTNEENKTNWESFKILPHIWSNDKSERYFASTLNEMKEVAQYIERIYAERIESENKNKINNSSPVSGPYYLIITDDYNAIADYNFTKNILKNGKQLNIGMLIANEKLSNLPNECKCFININAESSGLIENELITTNQKMFMADFPGNIDLSKCCLILANIPIIIESKNKELPDSYGFLELYNIGKVEQLNALNRWKTNDPTISLSAPIGIDESGEIFKLDLHEKFHGPHGLVAGTTGSGKSEWLITFILSMSINYSPDEVQFVIIDYKGGGLALAFENKELGIKLPHIVGTLTNLEVNELNRSLASIESELKRRQKEFNNARDISGESTIDIYKYQRLYRDGAVDKPISHLFIISDEFAELKAQQPEFMNQLVSISRIGRSLGVHLILATQKPAGVVNDQIWSNSRFKVCLKVQDKDDSNDMIKVPDAAALKQAGRFYLLVGYNDYFALGQAAYCGMPYIPSEKIIKKVDTNLTFINNSGYVIKRIDDFKKQDTTVKNGEVLLNVVKYLSQTANSSNFKETQLWLDRIPNIIFVDDLKRKYNYQKENYIINPVIGEYDNPANQSQHLLTLPLSQEGNTIIYGMAGSGKEDLLTSFVYSAITTYVTEELNLYIVDCGAETLKIFSKAPQIGDVVTTTEVEKINNLFKLINSSIEERKKLFIDYGGTLLNYNLYSGKKLPTIIVIINNYETFAENYESLEDNFVKVTRDGFKYGIIFIITCSATNSIRIKIKQNFSQNLVLQMVDFLDYSNILGNIHRMVPSENKGRGLIKLDEPYEFQSAFVCPEKDLVERIKQLCDNLQQHLSTKAKKIPVLPEYIDINYLVEEQTKLNALPIGIFKHTLGFAYYDFKTNNINLISTTSINNGKNFINGLIGMLKTTNSNITIIDTYDLVSESNKNDVIYGNENYLNIINKLNNETDPMIVVVIGLDNLFTELNDDKQSILNVFNQNNMNFIIYDTNNNLKKYNYDEWYQNKVKKDNGIWIGNGITEQNIFKLLKIDRDLYNLIGNEFGYVIVDGIQSLVKFVNENNPQDLGDSNE